MGNIYKTLANELADFEHETKAVRQLTEHAMASRLLCLFFAGTGTRAL
ncbi:MAG: hypothetical protein WB660_24700 [Candidatus Sulfotelmatobacter sp.]